MNIWWPAIFIQGQNITFENNIVRFCDFGGVGCHGENNIIRNNTIKWCGNNGIGSMGSGHLIENNIIRYNNYRKFNHEWNAGGIKATACKDTIFRNNYVFAS
ncbi:MAG: right-handed parallel beta-helix repeat-containing protein, partial [Armatimonadota bacterium]